MRLLFAAIFLVWNPAAGMAVTGPDDIRALAYAGDVERLEQVFAQAHAQSLSGELEFD